jgi:hypothetical protein
VSEVTVYTEAEFTQAFREGFERIVLDGKSGWWKLPPQAVDYGFDFLDDGRTVMVKVSG